MAAPPNGAGRTYFQLSHPELCQGHELRDAHAGAALDPALGLFETDLADVIALVSDLDVLVRRDVFLRVATCARVLRHELAPTVSDCF